MDETHANPLARLLPNRDRGRYRSFVPVMSNFRTISLRRLTVVEIQRSTETRMAMDCSVICLNGQEKSRGDAKSVDAVGMQRGGGSEHNEKSDQAAWQGARP
jgi:hypothetical protein